MFVISIKQLMERREQLSLCNMNHWHVANYRYTKEMETEKGRSRRSEFRKTAFRKLSSFQTDSHYYLSICKCQRVLLTMGTQIVAGQTICIVSNIILWSSLIGYGGYHTYKKTFGCKKPDNTKPEVNSTQSTPKQE